VCSLLKIHRGEQCVQKRTEANPTKAKNAARDGLPRPNGVLGFVTISLPKGRVVCFNARHIGYKFETISVLDKTWDAATREEIEGREDLVVNNNAQYCSIARTGIGRAKLVLGGEVDASMLFPVLQRPHSKCVSNCGLVLFDSLGQ
jgi:hypothetical protein